MSEPTVTDAPSGTLPLVGALEQLRTELGRMRLTLATDHAAEARRVRTELADQIDDYLLPRLRSMDAPLLLVVGGSTGAGKSTLVNSLLDAEVSQSGVLRPTTIAPVLICHPSERYWFDSDRILPDLARLSGTGSTSDARTLRITTSDRVPAGVALLDAPDIDSVNESNRQLAAQLLAAADSWLFVTTAARYADAVPWDLLNAARERGTSLTLVLDRVSRDAAPDIVEHLTTMLAERGLANAPILVVPETTLVDGRLPDAACAPVRRLLDELAHDASARTGVVSRTLDGTIASIPSRVSLLQNALAEQAAVHDDLSGAVERAYSDALDRIAEATRDGSMLRGEVLARWHDVIGTGDFMRILEGHVSRLRDKVRAFVTGRPHAEADLRTALQTGVESVVVSSVDRAAERVADAWRASLAGRELLADHTRVDAAGADLSARVTDEVRAWQGDVLDLVREEGSERRTSARIASLGVNAMGLLVMVGVFASTGGLTGTEVVVAGGTSALGQKVLEAIFGDQAVRELSARARELLMTRIRAVLDEDADRYRSLLDAATGQPHERSDALSRAVAGVQRGAA